MKTSEMRNMNINEIQEQINKLKLEVASLGLKIATSDSSAIKERRLKKKEIARLSTIETEKKILEEVKKEDKDA